MSAIQKKVLETRVLESSSHEELNSQLLSLQKGNRDANGTVWEPADNIVVANINSPSTSYANIKYILLVNRYTIVLHGD